MSILIPGMEMPTSCAKCKLFGEYGCPFIGAVGYALTRGERNEDCPLIPVPDHGRLAYVDSICKECRRIAEEYDGIYPDCTYCPVHLAPTIIPADPADKEGQT